MKTSFYFFLWFIIYYLIGLTGSQLLIQNDFFVALILVFFISKIINKLLYKEIQYQANLNRTYIFEIFYSNDVKKMLKIARQKFLTQTIWAIYCMLTIAGLLALHNTDLFIYVVFGLIGVMSMIASSKSFSQYRTIKENGLPPFMNHNSQMRKIIIEDIVNSEVSIQHRHFNRKYRQSPNGSILYL